INSQTKNISKLSKNINNNNNNKFSKLFCIDHSIYIFSNYGFAIILDQNIEFIFYNIQGVEDAFISNLYYSGNYLYILFDGLGDLNTVLIFDWKSKLVKKVISIPGLQNYFESSSSRITQYYDSDTNSTKFIIEALNSGDLVLNNYEFKNYINPSIKYINDSFIVVDNKLNIYSIKNEYISKLFESKDISEIFRPSFEISENLMFVSINDNVYKFEFSKNKLSHIYKFDLKDNCRYGISKLILTGNKLLLLINRFQITNYENCVSLVFIDI
ncbi:MAG TPA: hypothetical protein PLG90_13465, partial [Ignavibacteria bacterium]|nr:hypothetical protein [Ignavibacteria bacterium]